MSLGVKAFRAATLAAKKGSRSVKRAAQGAGLLPESTATPMWQAAGVATLPAAGSFLAEEVAMPLVGAVRDALNPSKKMQRTALALLRQRQIAMADAAKAERLQRMTAENTARLAAFAPDVYNQVLAGRRLPPDAVLLGSPNGAQERLQRIALAMGQGGFQEPESAEQRLARELTR